MAGKPKLIVNPPIFSGSSTEDAFKFLQKFELVAGANTWNNDVKLAVFPTALTSTAELWYYGWVKTRQRQQEAHNASAAAAAAVIAANTAAGASGPVLPIPPISPAPPPLTWDLIVQDIQKAFRSCASKEVAEQKLLARRQKIGESAESYIYAMVDLINDYDGNMPEDEMCRIIIRKMRSTFIDRVNQHSPKTIHDLLTVTRKVQETLYLLDNSDHNVAVNAINAKLEEHTQKIEDKLSKAFETLQTSLDTRESRPRQVRFSTENHPSANTAYDDNLNIREQRPSNFNRNTVGRRSFNSSTGSTFPQPRNTPSFNIANVQCFKCSGYGHYANNCSDRRVDVQPNNRRVFCTQCRTNTHHTNDCYSLKNGQRPAPSRPPRQQSGRSARPPNQPHPNQSQVNQPPPNLNNQ